MTGRTSVSDQMGEGVAKSKKKKKNSGYEIRQKGPEM